jgi:hypothetical protein
MSDCGPFSNISGRRHRLIQSGPCLLRYLTYRFRPKDLEPSAFTGIWEFSRLGGEEILSAAMIVGEQNPLVGA